MQKHRHSTAGRETRPGLIGARQGCRNRWTIEAGKAGRSPAEQAWLVEHHSAERAFLGFQGCVVQGDLVRSGQGEEGFTGGTAAKRTVRKGHGGPRPCALVPDEQ